MAVEFGWTKADGLIDRQRDYFKSVLRGGQLENCTENRLCDKEIFIGEEWNVLKEAILRDKEVINRASKDSGVSSRLIVSALIVEQLRLFHSDREIFK